MSELSRDDADAQLRKAIQDHAKAWGICDEDELLSSWVIVAHWQKVEANGLSNYTTQFDGNQMPTHVSVGLLHTGIHLITHEEQEE